MGWQTADWFFLLIFALLIAAVGFGYYRRRGRVGLLGAGDQRPKSADKNGRSGPKINI